MIKVNSRIKLNTAKIARINQAAITALAQTVEALRTEVIQAQVMPFQKGNLQNESTFIDTSDAGSGKVSIISDTPYARRLYYHPEYHFKTDENPNAKGHWYEDWEKGGSKQDFASKAFTELFRKAARL